MIGILYVRPIQMSWYNLLLYPTCDTICLSLLPSGALSLSLSLSASYISCKIILTSKCNWNCATDGNAVFSLAIGVYYTIMIIILLLYNSYCTQCVAKYILPNSLMSCILRLLKLVSIVAISLAAMSACLY